MNSLPGPLRKVARRFVGERGGYVGAFAQGGVADMAHGGPVPGAPLGTPAADGRGNADVAPGEAVLTGHHQGPVQRAMAFAKSMGQGAYGSLEEMFAKVKTRHSVPAGGGFGAFATGGKVDAKGMPKGWQTATGNTANPYVATSTYREGRRDRDEARRFEQTFFRDVGRANRMHGPRDTRPSQRGVNAWVSAVRRFGRQVGIHGGGPGPNTEPQDDPQQIDRMLSMWQSRYDLTEEEFVRDGVLSKPDITRRMREINHLISIQQRKMRYLSASREEGKSAVYWLDRGGKLLTTMMREADPRASLDGIKEDREEYAGYKKSWRELLRNRPFELFEHKTSLMEMQNERSRLLPNNWPALLAAAGDGGGGSGGASGDDGRMQRQIDRLTAELQSSRGLAVFGGSNDIGSGGRPGLLALRHGGVVPGTGPPDSRLALVSPGERWSTPQANEQFGDVYDALERSAARQGLSASRRGGGGEGPGMSFEPLQPLTDGRTLGLLSGAVTAGMARQGHRTSTRERTGL